MRDSNYAFYALSDKNIRKLNLSAQTISKPLVQEVISFEMYEKNRVISYVGHGKVGSGDRVVGIYRVGDDTPSIVRTVSKKSKATFYLRGYIMGCLKQINLPQQRKMVHILSNF